ncbi:MAG TPA: AarF/ABC1/UbiB kinase family protein [Terracidiphilus sp.]
MRTLAFLRLLNTIFRDKEPDVDWIERSGLLAVKIGQIFALRPDFLGEDRCRTLARLYRNTHSIAPEDAMKLIAEYAGSGFLESFLVFEKEPFASASIGQVHRAQLRSGARVAVKLIKRDQAEAFRRDVERVRYLLRIALFLYPALRGVANPISLLEQIEKMTTSELDLRNEVRGWKELNRLRVEAESDYDLSKMGLSNVYEELSNEKILVSEYVDGTTLDELLAHNRLQYETLLDLFHVHGYFLFSVGTFHGDIHPGNIVLKDGVFYFVDTGHLGHVQPQMRESLFAFFEALSRDAYAECATWLNQMADRGIEGARFERFEQKFLDLYADFKGKTVSEVSLTQKMMDTIRLGVLSGMYFDKGMFDIIKSLMFLDGMVIRANPGAVLLHDMRRFIDDLSLTTNHEIGKNDERR